MLARDADRFAWFRPFCRSTGAWLWLVWTLGGCGVDSASDEVPMMAMSSAGVGSAGRPDSAMVGAGRVATVAVAGTHAAGRGDKDAAAVGGVGGAATPSSAATTSGAAGSGGATPAGSCARSAAGNGSDATTLGGTANSCGSGGAGTSRGGAGSCARSAAGSDGANLCGAAGECGSSAAGSGGSATSDLPLTVFIASDSTASDYKDTGSDNDQAGWGQMLPELVKPFAKVANRAIGGRTARRFIDEGRLDQIWAELKPGDYLLVQFGTNDGNRNASYELNGMTIPYYSDPATDFKTWVRRYIEGAKERGAVPVLVTPPPRNSAYCTGGNGTNAHAQALRELGESDAVAVVDLNMKTVDYLQAICPEPSAPDFFLQRADGTVDGTHFQERGARKLASFVAEGLRELAVTWVEEP